MKKYYNGYITNSDILKYNYSVGDYLTLHDESLNDNFRRPFMSLINYDDRKYFLNSLAKLRNSVYSNDEIKIEDQQTLNIIERMKFPLSVKYNSLFDSRYETVKIIYCIVEDIHGNKYAQEITTKLVFPLYSKETYDFEYYLIKYDLQYRKNYNQTFTLKVIPRVKSPFISLAKSVVLEDSVASISDVESYRSALEDVNKLYKKNAFSDQLILKKDIEVSQTEEMVLLQDIEYILYRIKQISGVEESKLRKEYDSVILNYKNDNCNVPISIDYLRDFKNKVSFKFYFNKNAGVDSFLSNIYNNICNKINGKGTKTISIKDIDYLYEIFLLYSNDLNLEEQNKLLKLFTITYIAKIKEEDLDLFEVEKTRFVELLKYAACELFISPDNLEELLDKIKNKKEFHVLKLGK